MEAWRKIRLGDACKTNANSYSPKEEWDFVNYLDTGNITNNRIDSIQFIDVRSEKLPSRARRKVKKDSIIYSTVRPNQHHFGIIKSQPEHFLVSTGFAVIDVDANVLDADFLYYLLTQAALVEALHAIAEQSTSAYPSIKPSDIEDLEIEIPDLATQKKIADVLGSMDRRITQNTGINNNLQQQAQAIYSSMFIDNPDPVWSHGHLSELITVKYGKDHKKLADGIYPVYGSGGIMRYVERPLYNKESVLIPRKGTLNNVIYVNQPFWSVDTMFYTEMKIPNVAKFVYHFVKAKDLAFMNAGSAVPSMTTDILNAMEVVIPSASALEEFESLVAPMYEAMEANDVQSQTLSTMRDTLLPKLMSGEIDVSAVQI